MGYLLTSKKFKQFYKKKIVEVLGSDDLLTLSTATSDQLFQATVSFVKLPSSLNQLKVGDIVKLSLGNLNFSSKKKLMFCRKSIKHFWSTRSILWNSSYLEKFITFTTAWPQIGSNTGGQFSAFSKQCNLRSYIRHMTTDMVAYFSNVVKLFILNKGYQQLSIWPSISGLD
jgi:hypothetical protein